MFFLSPGLKNLQSLVSSPSQHLLMLIKSLLNLLDKMGCAPLVPHSGPLSPALKDDGCTAFLPCTFFKLYFKTQAAASHCHNTGVQPAPISLCPTALPVPAGHPASYSAQWATLHHLLNPCFPNHAMPMAKGIHCPASAETPGQVQSKATDSSPFPPGAWGWHDAMKWVHNSGVFPPRSPK